MAYCMIKMSLSGVFSCCCSVAKSCLTLTPWTVAHWAALPMGSPGKNTGVGCHFLLQGIFPDQGSNLSLLHWQGNSLPLIHQGRPVLGIFVEKSQILHAAAAAVTSVVSDSVWPHRRQPTRLPRPWGSSGKNSGVGCHFLRQMSQILKHSYYFSEI